MKQSENLFIFNKILNMLLFLILNKIKVGIVRNALNVMFTRSADTSTSMHKHFLTHTHAV